MDKLGYWSMSIKDNNTLAYMLSEVPLLPGLGPTANLFRQFGYKLMGSFYVVKLSDNVNLQHPDEGGLGGNWMLVWGDTAESSIDEAYSI